MQTIQMGNDEFILYVRKHSKDCTKSTRELGRRIWLWIRDNDSNARKYIESQPCLWEDTGLFVSEHNLPKTATQFIFDRALLPRLYDYLDTM